MRNDLIMRPSPATPETPWALHIRTLSVEECELKYEMVTLLTEEASGKLFKAGLISAFYGTPETKT